LCFLDKKLEDKDSKKNDVIKINIKLQCPEHYLF
jgi:hypothetical protein